MIREILQLFVEFIFQIAPSIKANTAYIHEASEKSCYTYLNPDYPVTVSDSKNENRFTLTAEQVKEEFNSYKNKEKETVNDKDNVENDFELDEPEK